MKIKGEFCIYFSKKKMTLGKDLHKNNGTRRKHEWQTNKDRTSKNELGIMSANHVLPKDNVIYRVLIKSLLYQSIKGRLSVIQFSPVIPRDLNSGML